MAPRKDYESLEESTDSGSNDQTSNAGSAAEPREQNENPDYPAISCAAILEPSEDDPLFKRETIRRPLKTYRAIMKSISSSRIYVNSDELSNDEENGQLMHGRHSYCADLLNRYKISAEKFRNSKLIYIVQFLLILLSVSATVMGKNYAESCPGSPSLPTLSMLTGIVALFLIALWMGIKCCDPDDRPCDGYQKFLILLFFLSVSALLELEIYLFCHVSSSVQPTATNYCNKTFYNYTYYKFIAAFLSMLLVVLLYFPDYRRLASEVTCSNPVTNNCYNGLLEDDEE